MAVLESELMMFLLLGWLAEYTTSGCGRLMHGLIMLLGHTSLLVE